MGAAAQKANMAVLITRPRKQAEEFARTIRAPGIKSVIAPMLEIIPEDFSLPNPSLYKSLVFTSANAVRAFAQKPGSGAFHGLSVYTAGLQSKAAAESIGFKHVKASNHGAKSIADEVAADDAGREGAILYMRGAETAVPLELMLGARGFTVESVVAYTARSVGEVPEEAVGLLSPENKDNLAVTFFSKRTAENFIKLAVENGFVSRFRNAKALCISPSVLECVQQQNWAGTYAANHPDGGGMAELVEQEFKRNG